MEISFLNDMKKEHNEIDNNWLNLHYQGTIVVVLLVFVLECLIGIILYYTDEINTTIPLYLMKFLIIPSSVNVLCLFIEFKVMRSNRISQETKKTTVSLSLVFIFFVVYMVHSAFLSLYFIFSLSILLTTIYGNYRLTTLTAILSLMSIISSDLIFLWDEDKISVLDNGINFSNFLISLFILISFYFVSLVVISFEKERNVAFLKKEREKTKLIEFSQIDELTGLNNRVAFRNAMEDMENDSCNNKYIFVMIDLDNFKLLNDNFGHLEGDHCLLLFSSILKMNCNGGIPFRYGGDEFSIMFKNTTMKQVITYCEGIQNEFTSNDQIVKSNLPLSVSFGVSIYKCGTAPSKLIKNSDTALYQSKRTKNKITIFNASCIK
ncbi:GGDEF domain-containing protein [Oceanispirochaeta sp. M1]|uniref:GGDEF domain-containing protein n=1 Tax=Oceanispirochaeta sp. M1 TaxID=2283433 RepID=UPI000E09D66D|nr:GGDEF domain-containing protein [Oceanispirochaeta sp. M1]NPD75307.1 GGDEF domain-containing protein [Oceanispirochaeta sp. M1]RDG28831.1 GGDEF domain-containing protein [Oceanispirochaeta sp. M1]